MHFSNFFTMTVYLCQGRGRIQIKGKNSKLLLSEHSTSQTLLIIIHSSISFIFSLSLSPWQPGCPSVWIIGLWPTGKQVAQAALSPKVRLGGVSASPGGAGWFPLSLARERAQMEGSCAPPPVCAPPPSLAPLVFFWPDE